MANTGFPPKQWKKDAFGEFLTFIVPAVGGCNLKCPFCFIAQREEIAATRLAPEDYVRFIEGVAEVEPVAGVAIQGYEPLLPEALAYTAAILRSVGALGLPSSLVTNGIELRAALPLLRQHRPDRVGVSLDAATARRHDKLRGKQGAWQATVDAIAHSIAPLARAGTQLTVISVLMPGQRADLDAMPALLSQIGVRDWIVNPLTVIKSNKWADSEAGRCLPEDLLALAERAREHGVAFKVDDEFGLLQSALPALRSLRREGVTIRSLPEGITLSRLTPGGQCSVGSQIAGRLPLDVPSWTAASLHPALFLQAQRTGAAFQARAAG
jgi:sulfatase maturation enzyme AslB (radical SAM superfamily)